MEEEGRVPGGEGVGGGSILKHESLELSGPHLSYLSLSLPSTDELGKYHRAV